MTQEEKQLLIKDLCARVPYRTFVCLNPGAYNKPETCLLIGVHGEEVHLNVDSDPFRVDHIKPYLRSISSMTVEEWDEYYHYGTRGILNPKNEVCGIDWLNKYHFDYRGLIKMGLALKAPEGMYKTK